MKSSNYTIVRYSPELRDQVLKIQTHLWGNNSAANDNYLEWKYFQNPYNKEIFIYLAVYKNEVIGMLGLFGTYWEVGGEDTKFTCLMGVDAVVHPDHRRKGVLRKLITASWEDMPSSGYAYRISLSASPFSASAALGLGWQNAGNLQETYRPGRSGKTLSFLGRKLLSNGIGGLKRHTPFTKYSKISAETPLPAKPFHSFDKRAKKRCPKGGRLCVLSDNIPQIDDMVDLAARTSPNGRIQHVRDHDFFRWRFQNPFSSYRFIYLDKGGSLEGYLVLQALRKSRNPRISIVDCHAESTKVWSDLISTAVDWCGDANMMTWTATLSKDKSNVLQGLGFDIFNETAKSQEKTSSHSLLIKPIHSDNLNTKWKLGDLQLLDPKNWHLQPIISDNF